MDSQPRGRGIKSAYWNVWEMFTKIFKKKVDKRVTKNCCNHCIYLPVSKPPEWETRECWWWTLACGKWRRGGRSWRGRWPAGPRWPFVGPMKRSRLRRRLLRGRWWSAVEVVVAVGWRVGGGVWSPSRSDSLAGSGRWTELHPRIW